MDSMTFYVFLIVVAAIGWIVALIYDHKHRHPTQS